MCNITTPRIYAQTPACTQELLPRQRQARPQVQSIICSLTLTDSRNGKLSQAWHRDSSSPLSLTASSSRDPTVILGDASRPNSARMPWEKNRSRSDPTNTADPRPRNITYNFFNRRLKGHGGFFAFFTPTRLIERKQEFSSLGPPSSASAPLLWTKKKSSENGCLTSQVSRGRHGLAPQIGSHCELQSLPAEEKEHPLQKKVNMATRVTYHTFLLRAVKVFTHLAFKVHVYNSSTREGCFVSFQGDSFCPFLPSHVQQT